MAIYRIGDLVSFSYKGEYSHEPFPEVLILHTSWRRRNFPKEAPKVHGLCWNYLSDPEINYMKAILNPIFAQELSKKDPIMRQRLASIGAMSAYVGTKIDSPFDFYRRVVKPFIIRHDSYRLYFPQNMLNIKVLTKKEIMTGKDKKKGLFSGYIDRMKALTRRI